MRAPISSYLLVFLFGAPTLAAGPAAAKMDKELEEQVYSVLERANRSGDHVTRALATEAFSTLRPKETRSYALDALKDPVFEVRAAAIRALIEMGDKGWEQALLDDMKNPRVDIQAQIMPILAELSDKEAVSIAQQVLADEKAPTRNDVIKAFGEAGGKRAILLFKPLMTDKKDTALAEAIQGYVLTLRGEDALPLLELVLKVGTPEMQQRALEALAAYPKGTDIKVARKLLKSKDEAMALRAAEVLAYHGDAAGKDILLDVVANGTEAEIKRALDALIPIASKDMVDELRGFVRKDNTDPEILKRVLEIYYQAKDKSLIDVLRKMRRHDNIRVQALGVYYLGLLEQGRALPTLHEDLFHGDPFVRKAAIEAVSKIGSRESIEPLRRALDNTREPEMRALIVEALAGIRDKEIIPILNFLITDPNPEVRRWAIIGLSRAGHADAVPSLRIAANDADIEARAEAIKAIMALDKAEGPTTFRMALGWLPPEKLGELAKELGDEMLPYLDMALTSDREEIWREAIEVLKAYPKKEDGILAAAYDRTRTPEIKVAILERLVEKNGAAEMPRLMAAADDTDRAIREAAFRLMGDLGNADADPVLRKALFDSDERLRVRAAVALIDIHESKKTRRGRRGRR